MFRVINEEEDIAIYENDSIYAFFNPDNMKLGFISKENAKIDEIKKEFLENENVEKCENEQRNLMLRLLITSRCNLNCSYCQMKKLTKGHDGTDMKKERIVELLSKFKNENYDYITIHFSGGEPLVAKDIIEFTCEETNTMNIKNVRFAISTNGLLLSDEVVDILKRYDIQTVVSIDGLDNEKTERRDFLGNSTIGKVLEACVCAQNRGLKIGISTVFMKENCDTSVDLVKTLYERYGIKSVGFNYQHYSGFEKKNVDVTDDYMNVYADTLMEVLRYCRVHNIFEEQSNRIIEPFALNKPRKSHCSSQTSQITVMPNGLLGPCKTFVSAEKDCIMIDDFLESSKAKNEIFQRWHKRVVANIDECKCCSYRGLCGGGCPYEAYVDNNDIFFPDKRYCVVPRTIFLGILCDLQEKGAFRSSTDQLRYIDDEYRKMILTCNNADKYKLTASIGHFIDD